MDYFKLTRCFWDFAFDNPEKIKPNHCALYLFIIEHCNRLGWKQKFGLPTTMVKDAIGVRSYNTYIKTLNDLVDFGFIDLIEKSKNQYSSNIIAISNFNKAHSKALNKALIKHDIKQSESIVQSIDSINKQYTINNIQDTRYPEKLFLENWSTCRLSYLNKPTHISKLTNWEKTNFNIAVNQFGKEKINLALHGLFKQENIQIQSMVLKPNHFLENVDKYYQAEMSNEYELYGKKKKNV